VTSLRFAPFHIGDVPYFGFGDGCVRVDEVRYIQVGTDGYARVRLYSDETIIFAPLTGDERPDGETVHDVVAWQ
jgi:hypothetical protein